MRRLRLGILIDPPSSGGPPLPWRYARMSRWGRRLGMEVCLFSAAGIDWEAMRTDAFLCESGDSRWTMRPVPLPSLVYDRTFPRHAAARRAAREAVRKLTARGVRVLGSGLPGKWKVYRILYESETLRPLLPNTAPLSNADELSGWLAAHRAVFLKPEGGSQGRGCLRIDPLPGGGYALTGRDLRNRRFRLSAGTRDQAAALALRLIRSRRYVVQPALTLFSSEGHPFDIRVLVQRNGSGRWQITGTAVRIGDPEGATSNLHGGGTAREARSFLEREFGEPAASRVLSLIHSAAMAVPERIERAFGGFCEFGIDFGVDRSGNVWLLEVNSKPGRTAFSLSGQREEGIRALLNPLLYARRLLSLQPDAPRPAGALQTLGRLKS